MTVAELIKELESIEDKSRIVILQKDAEGNGYSPLYSCTTGAYDADSTWSGEVSLEFGDLDDELRAQGYSDEDVSLSGAPCVVLCPVN
jgi:hypothetical protein